MRSREFFHHPHGQEDRAERKKHIYRETEGGRERERETGKWSRRDESYRERRTLVQKTLSTRARARARYFSLLMNPARGKPLERHFYCCHSVCRQFTMAIRGIARCRHADSRMFHLRSRLVPPPYLPGPGLEAENTARRNFVFYHLKDADVPINSALKQRRFEQSWRTKGKWIISSLYGLGESYGCERVEDSKDTLFATGEIMRERERGGRGRHNVHIYFA